jgi:hypothetical protein
MAGIGDGIEVGERADLPAEAYQALVALDLSAQQHFGRALDLVKVGGDRQFGAHILASMSHLAHHLDQPEEAIQLASVAEKRSRVAHHNPNSKRACSRCKHAVSPRSGSRASAHSPSSRPRRRWPFARRGAIAVDQRLR